MTPKSYSIKSGSSTASLMMLWLMSIEPLLLSDALLLFAGMNALAMDKQLLFMGLFPSWCAEWGRLNLIKEPALLDLRDFCGLRLSGSALAFLQTYSLNGDLLTSTSSFDSSLLNASSYFSVISLPIVFLPSNALCYASTSRICFSISPIAVSTFEN